MSSKGECKLKKHLYVDQEYWSECANGSTFSTLYPSLARINMCIDKNYIVLLSVIYALQNCKVAPRELESESVEGYAINYA